MYRPKTGIYIYIYIYIYDMFWIVEGKELDTQKKN
jgi:hypothetical protein